jgi:CRP-like cAMP-binding protein
MPGRESPFAKFISHYKKGDFVFREGEEGEGMYIIQSGKVAIQKLLRGKRTTLSVLEKGDFFGEMSILESMPRTADAEVMEETDLIMINKQTFGEMIRSNPEIAVRMLRKYSMRMRETSEQMEALMAAQEGREALGAGQGLQEVRVPPPEVVNPSATLSEVKQPSTAQTSGAGTPAARAYFIGKSSGRVYPVYKDEVLLGRYDSVTGGRPEVDLTQEDQNRNISRRHARLLLKSGQYFVAEEIGTMNGTYLNGKKLPTGVLTPIKDGDELLLCRVPLTFKVVT